MSMKIYRAIVLDTDGTILSVLDSEKKITPELLTKTPYSGKDIRAIETGEYASGHKLAEYTPDGKLRPILDRVKEGLCEPPLGYQLLDGELVPSNPTPKETPKYLQDTIDNLRKQIADLQKAALDL